MSQLGSVNAQTVANSNERQKRKIIKKIKASQSLQIYSDNSQGSPLYIQEASVKEISGDDFTKLAGETSKNLKQATFPDVTLVNSSGKTIRSFAIAVKSSVDKPKSGYILLKNKLSISPNSTFSVALSEWPKAERGSIQKGDRFIYGLRRPGLDSAKSWIPGAASDLSVTVGFVEFEDGTRWMISRDSDW
jgi:hypothetical protein